MEELEDGVRFPMTNKADDIAVNAATKEHHVAAGIETPSGEISGGEAKVSKGSDRDLEQGVDHVTGDILHVVLDWKAQNSVLRVAWINRK